MMALARVEVCFLIGREGAVLWADASTSPVALPDSRARWEAIWRLKDQLAEIAHSHPLGPLGFSTEDQTTMEALDSALGRAVRFSVIAPSGTWVREPDRTEHSANSEPWWAELMRAASGFEKED